MAKRRKKQETNYVIWSVVLGLIILIAVVATGYFWWSGQSERTDKQTLCPVSGATAHTVLLIDKTDPLNFTQKQAFHVWLNGFIANEIEKGELVSVFALGEDFQQNDKPLLEICNPGDGSDKSELTANLKRLKRQFEDRFLTPILNVGNELLAVTPAKQSPIMEQIQMASINGFQQHHIEGSKRLIIVSDMLHNTAGFSMYKNPKTAYNDFIKLDYAQRVKPYLNGVRVEIIYVMNTPKLQNRGNLFFWEQFFNAAGARVSQVRPLEG